MGKLAEIEFVYFDKMQNRTVVLHGDVDPRVILWNNDTVNDEVAGNSTTTKAYDDKGALTYVVAVIIVYSISMFLLIVTLARKKSMTKDLDIEVEKYIKGMEGAQRQAKVESVLRMRLKWPGNFIGLRFSARHPDHIHGSSLSDDDREIDDAISESDDNGSYLEMPATTLISRYNEFGGEQSVVHESDYVLNDNFYRQSPEGFDMLDPDELTRIHAYDPWVRRGRRKSINTIPVNVTEIENEASSSPLSSHPYQKLPHILPPNTIVTQDAEETDTVDPAVIGHAVDSPSLPRTIPSIVVSSSRSNISGSHQITQDPESHAGGQKYPSRFNRQRRSGVINNV